MDPTVQLLLLEQEGRSLEDHTRDFVDLTHLIRYPNSCLCMFYYVGLTTATKTKLSGHDPRGSFAAFMEWLLEQNGLYFAICPAEEDISSPTPEPETSQPSSGCTELKPEPTADRESEPYVIDCSSPIL